MEESSDLISDVVLGISKLTETDLEKTNGDMSQVTEDEIEQIARPVDGL